MGVTTGIAAVVGPALGGLLLEVISGTYTVLLCAAGIGTVTLLATISPTLRTFPRHAAEVPAATVPAQEQRAEP